MVGPNIVTRRMSPADRAEVVADFFHGDDKPLSQPQGSTHIIEEDGVIVGVAFGLRPSDTSMPANWGNIILKEPDNMTHWVKLMLAKVQDAVDDGFTEGFTRTRRANLIPIGESYFGVQAVEVGWEPRLATDVTPRVAVEWEFRTNLTTFLETLKRLDGSP